MNFKVDSFDEGDYLDLLLVFVKYNCLAYLSLYFIFFFLQKQLCVLPNSSFYLTFALVFVFLPSARASFMVVK